MSHHFIPPLRISIYGTLLPLLAISSGQIVPPLVIVKHDPASITYHYDNSVTTRTAHGNCSLFEQQEVQRCAEPLYEIGAFRQDKDGNGFEFSWEYFVTRTKEYFSEVCDNFFVFDLCIDPYKDTCFNQEPVRSRYQTAVKILDFLCKDGYGEMVRNFECFTRTLTRAEMMQCQAEMVADTRRVPPPESVGQQIHEAAVCGAMKNYVDCVKYPIRYECGYRAWYVVREIMVRPTVALLPHCDIASASGAFSFSLAVHLSFVGIVHSLF